MNVTLLFSLGRHRQAAEAYVRGLQRCTRPAATWRARIGRSFFVSRVDTEADRRLDEIGGHDDLKGKLAIANAKLAYQTYLQVFSGLEWEELPPPARRRSAACGHRPPPRTRSTAT